MQAIQKIVKITSFDSCSKRFLSTTLIRTAGNPPPASDSEAWQIDSYGGPDELKLNQVRTPILSSPDQVLVKVHAASVNPIDVAMLGGYGATALNVLRQKENCSKNPLPEFPLTLGRDFAGTVIGKGQGETDLQVGDEVWGVLSPHLQGSHARTVVVSKSCVAKKPKDLSMVDAGSMLYTSMTAWSSLQVTAGLGVLGASGKKVLVLGGSGGVGTAAVQLLEVWGARVTATCSADAVPLVQALGVSSVIDYTAPDFLQQVADAGKYDVIFDCAGLGTDGSRDYLPHLSENPLSKYITLSSPLLREMDSKGTVAGALSSFATLVMANLQAGSLPRLAPVRWAFFMPLPPALKEITSLASLKKLKPCVDSVFNFNDTPQAFTKLRAGHARGKIVINMEEKSTSK